MKKSFLIFFGIIAFFVLLFWYKQLNRPTYKTIPDALIVGTSADFKPMSFKERGQITGFDIDIVREVATRLGKTIELKDMPFELLMPQVQLGTIHMIAAGMTPTPERAECVFFTDAYLTGDPLIIVSLAKHVPLKNLATLEGKEVIVNQGYTADLYMSKIPGINLRRLPTVADALLALKTGRGDFFVTAANSMKPYFEKENINNFNVFVIEGTAESSALAISKQYPELAGRVSEVIKDMIKDGTIDKLKTTWHLS